MKRPDGRCLCSSLSVLNGYAITRATPHWFCIAGEFTHLPLMDILQWSAQHTDQTRPQGEAWPRTTKELGFYASHWPIVQERSRREWLKANSVNPWCDRPRFFHYKTGLRHLLHMTLISHAARNDFYLIIISYVRWNKSFALQLKTLLWLNEILAIFTKYHILADLP